MNDFDPWKSVLIRGAVGLAVDLGSCGFFDSSHHFFAASGYVLEVFNKATTITMEVFPNEI